MFTFFLPFSTDVMRRKHITRAVRSIRNKTPNHGKLASSVTLLGENSDQVCQKILSNCVRRDALTPLNRNIYFKHPKDWQHLDLRIAFSPLGRQIPVMFCIIKKAIMFFLSQIISQFAVNKKEQTLCLYEKITLWGTYFCVPKNMSLNMAFKVQHKAKSLFCNSGN